MINPWRRLRKIAHLPGTRRSAVVTLAAALEKARAGHVNSVYIGIEWDDGTFCGDWSSMEQRDLATHALMAQKNAFEHVQQGGEPA